MDAGDIALVVVGVLGAIAIVAGGFLLDRRSQRIESAAWMRNWTVLTRLRHELFQRWHGPLRLQDHSKTATPPKKRRRKPATRADKGSREPSR